MKTKDTMSDNELIAEFMGAQRREGPRAFNPEQTLVQWIIDGNPFNQHRDKGVKHWYTPEQLLYHQSWDWLMPVVEKIEKIGLCTNLNYTPDTGIRSFSIYDSEYRRTAKGNQFYAEGDNCVYNAVIKFIKWYNANQPKP